MQNTAATARYNFANAVTQGTNQEGQFQVEIECQTGIRTLPIKPVAHVKAGFRPAGKAQFNQWREMGHLESCLGTKPAVGTHLPAKNSDSHLTAGQLLQLANFR